MYKSQEFGQNKAHAYIDRVRLKHTLKTSSKTAYWSQKKLNWNWQNCFPCVLILPNWGFVGFAISQVGLSQIWKSLPDLQQRRRRSVSKIAVNYLWSIQSIISTTQPSEEHHKRVMGGRENQSICTIAKKGVDGCYICQMI